MQSLTPEIIAEHGITTEEYARIKKILGREPNITELTMQLQTVLLSHSVPITADPCTVKRSGRNTQKNLMSKNPLLTFFF